MPEQMYHNERFDWDLPLADKGLHRDPDMDAMTWMMMVVPLRPSPVDPNSTVYDLVKVSERKNKDDTTLTVNYKFKRVEARAPVLAMVVFTYDRPTWLLRLANVNPVSVKVLPMLTAGEDAGALAKLVSGMWTGEHYSEWYAHVV